MLSLHTNAASLSTQNSLGSTNKALGSSMTKLGTGFRVNSAMDDAAGLQIATRLNAQTRGMQVAQKNTQNGISMLQTAEGAMNEVQNILLRMKDLATESATATSSDKDRAAMQSEFDALGSELNNIFVNTSFGGARLFAGDTAKDPTTIGGKLGAAAVVFQIGTTATEQMSVDFTATGGSALETAVTDIATAVTTRFADPDATSGDEINSDTGAATTITNLNTALDSVSTFRSEMGAAANRLEHNFNNLGNMIQNTQAARGRIMDVDYATETSNMTSKQMLMQASTSMLKQSNSMSQMVASLLQ